MSPSRHHGLSCCGWQMSPALSVKNLSAIKPSSTAAAPNHEPWGFRLEKNRIPALDTWDEQRIYLNEFRFLDLLIHRKALNSFTWDAWFLWLVVIFWCSLMQGFFPSGKIPIHLAPLLPLWNSISEQRSCLPGYSSKYIPQIKLNNF